MAKEKYLRLGELLVKEGLINLTQLEKAVAVQRQEGGHLGEILVRLGMIKDEQLVSILAKQLNIPYFSLSTGMLKPAADQGLEKLIPQDFARKNCVMVCRSYFSRKGQGAIIVEWVNSRMGRLNWL